MLTISERCFNVFRNLGQKLIESLPSFSLSVLGFVAEYGSCLLLVLCERGLQLRLDCAMRPLFDLKSPLQLPWCVCVLGDLVLLGGRKQSPAVISLKSRSPVRGDLFPSGTEAIGFARIGSEVLD